MLIETWSNVLSNIFDPDTLNEGGRIVRSKFGNISSITRETILGRNTNLGTDDAWSEFYQECQTVLPEQYGIQVRSMPGGALQIESLSIPEEIGYSVAEELRMQNIEEGDAKESLINLTGDLFPRIDALSTDGIIGFSRNQINFDNFRSGFNSYIQGNKRYSFRQGAGFAFYIRPDDTKFIGGERKLENHIFKDQRSLLSNILISKLNSNNIDILPNSNEIASGRFRNPDMYAVGKRSLIEKDEIHLSVIEIKVDNKTPSLFTALAQANSYREMANYVWIMAPGLSENESRSPEQFRNFMHQCRSNGFGVMTLDLADDYRSVENIRITLDPVKREIHSLHLYRRVLESLALSYCLKCFRYISLEEAHSDNENTTSSFGCGRQIDGACARELEDRMLRSFVRDEESREPRT